LELNRSRCRISPLNLKTISFYVPCPRPTPRRGLAAISTILLATYPSRGGAALCRGGMGFSFLPCPPPSRPRTFIGSTYPGDFLNPQNRQRCQRFEEWPCAWPIQAFLAEFSAKLWGPQPDRAAGGARKVRRIEGFRASAITPTSRGCSSKVPHASTNVQSPTQPRRSGGSRHKRVVRGSGRRSLREQTRACGQQVVPPLLAGVQAVLDGLVGVSALRRRLIFRSHPRAQRAGGPCNWVLTPH